MERGENQEKMKDFLRNRTLLCYALLKKTGIVIGVSLNKIIIKKTI